MEGRGAMLFVGLTIFHFRAELNVALPPLLMFSEKLCDFPPARCAPVMVSSSDAPVRLGLFQ